MDYLLHYEAVRLLKARLRLRQVTRLCDGSHQTNVITSRRDLRDIDVAYCMFERWRQENFFKYMREEFLLDALVDYQIEPEDPTRTIPNPERRALDKEIRAARADLANIEREFGAAANNAERHRPTLRGFKIAHGKLGKQLRKACAHLSRLINQRRDAPTATIFPGSRLRVRFAMHRPRRIGLAFPGSPVEPSTPKDAAPAA